MRKHLPFAALICLGACGDATQPMAPTSESPNFALSSLNITNGYLAIDLGTLGGDRSQANAISDNGQIVGLSRAEPGQLFPFRAFLWDNGVMRDLGALPDQANSQAHDVNNAGQVVGSSSIPATAQSAFLWTSGNMTQLGDLGGFTQAYAINTAGHAAGGSAVGNGPTDKIHAVLWREDDITVLENLGGRQTQAFGINSAGQIVGWSQLPTGEFQPVLWGLDGQIETLASFDGPASAASDISEAGVIVGGSATPDWVMHAVLWRDDEMSVLPSFGGASGAAAINESGEIVGYSDMPSGSRRGVLWRDGSVIDLGTIGGSTSWATDINEAGQIVGFGETESGETHAILWVPANKPVQILKQLIAEVRKLEAADVINQGETTSLVQKLTNAIVGVENDRPNAVNVINAFTNEIDALVQGGILTPPEAQTLLDLAQLVMDLLDGA